MKKIKQIIILSIFAFSPSFVLGQSKGQNTQKNPIKSTKNSHGFWVNDEESALKEASLLKKPILIDFYGIWCPPCNQLDELVFATPEFKKAAKEFVLLKMDADQEKSWVLKSKYKVGGYPTIIMAEVTDNQAGQEIDRIVGFFPKDVIIKNMSDALTSGATDKTLALNNQIKKMLLLAESDGNTEQVLKLASAGLILNPDDLSLKISKLTAESEKNKDLVKQSDSKKIMTEIALRKKELSFTDLASAYRLKPTKEILDEMLSRVNPSTLYVDNESYNEGDIYGMGIDLAEAEKNESMKKTYLSATIESFEKLLKKYGQFSRSLNMSYVYYLKENNEIEKTKTVLNQLISKYPGEFTFHFKLAKLNLEIKDLAQAKAQAEKALSYAYGDNKIYSMQTVLEVAMAEAASNKDQKHNLKQVIIQAEDFIKGVAAPGELKVRTTRYAKKLADKIMEAKKVLE